MTYHMDRPVLIRDPVVNIYVVRSELPPPIVEVGYAGRPARPSNFVGKLLAAPFILIALAWALGSLFQG